MNYQLSALWECRSRGNLWSGLPDDAFAGCNIDRPLPCHAQHFTVLMDRDEYTRLRLLEDTQAEPLIRVTPASYQNGEFEQLGYLTILVTVVI